jgi:regulation of enolase protein 1 (concanavalin A-like superfamily)
VAARHRGGELRSDTVPRGSGLRAWQCAALLASLAATGVVLVAASRAPGPAPTAAHQEGAGPRATGVAHAAVTAMSGCSSQAFSRRAARDPVACRAAKRDLRKRLTAARAPAAAMSLGVPPWAAISEDAALHLTRERSRRINPLRSRINPLRSSLARVRTMPSWPLQRSPLGGLPLPGAQTRRFAGFASIQSDEFNSTSLDTSLWTYVDPVGDTTLTLTGTHAEIHVPSGIRHDLWVGADEAPRLLQAAPNADFEIETKFDFAVSSQYQLQGLLVVQDADEVLRVETHHDGVGTQLFVAAIAGQSASVLHYSSIAGGAPLYFRLKRDGNNWTLRYSHNGTSWVTGATFTRALAVSAIGPFAGNAGIFPPGFTSGIDYFRSLSESPSDTAPPVIASTEVTPSPMGATVTWTTDEPATSAVAYGADSAYGMGSMADRDLVGSHSVTFSGLACSTAYHLQIRSRDAAGNEASSTDFAFTTAACPTNIASDEFNSSSVDMNLWSFVDPIGDSALGSSGTQAVVSVPAGTRHDLWTNANEVPRLLQAVPNQDFEVMAKFDSSLSQQYQLQGIVVEQDSRNLLRFEVHHDGGGTRLFAASIVDGVATVRHHATVADGPPAYLRLRRVGDEWTVSYSSNGQTWPAAGTFSHPLMTRAMGPYAGNNGSPPPVFSAAVDYFRVVSAGAPPSDTAPPVISAVATMGRATSATLTWTTDEPATSAVDYGATTSYGGTVSAPELTTTHSVTLTGLTCESTYHFLVRSTDAAGNEARSTDGTFTAGSCPGGVVSDEFDRSALDQQLWRFLDPRGDSTTAVNGGQLQIGLADGASHDLWTDSLTAPRLLQTTRDADFTIEAKFDRPVTTAFQMQGLVAQQDDTDLIRYDAFSNGEETRLFAATFVNGVATGRLNEPIATGSPLFLRMRRAGDTWTLFYSRSGRTWTQAATFIHHLTITEVGLFAGNHGLVAGNSPAFTAAVDYFHNADTAPPPPPDTSPPIVRDVAVSAAMSTATVTWATDEPSGSTVRFGRTTSYGRVSSHAEYTSTHTVALSGLACETVYHFAVHSTDEDGNEGVSPDATFTTRQCPPPIHSDEFEGSTLDPSWSFQDRRRDSTLAPPSGGLVAISVPQGSAHDLWSGANDAPRLLQRTRDEDFEVELRFATPVSEQYQMEGLVVEQDDQNLLRFENHTDGARTVLFAAAINDGKAQTKHSSFIAGGGPVYLRVKRTGANWSFRYSSDGTFWSTPVTFTYPLTVTALGPFVGNGGNPAPAFTSRIDYFRVLSLGTPPPDTTPPVVGNVATTAEVDSAVITWLTDEPAITSVRYGTSTSYGATVSSSELRTSHDADLVDLDCETVYHFQIVARDEVGNEAATGDRTFTTGTCPPPDVTPPVITSVNVQPNVRSAYVTWATDEPATSTVEFGADATYGSAVADTTRVTTHRVFLPNLDCDTPYHFRVTSRDKAGNTAQTLDSVFRTAACPPPGGPDIDIWYGDDQVFGTIGTPQNWGNIMGHAEDPDGLAYVDYSLNGGPYTGLTISPEANPRIGRDGDFNIELDLAQLPPGPNQVEIVATDRRGYETHRLVTVRYDGLTQWPFPYTTNWSSAARIADVAQVVDGLWTIEGDNVRPVEPGYDRVITFGERTWKNYEVSAPFTINRLTFDTWHQGFGLAVGWQGHAGTARPRMEYPFGMICFYYRRNPYESYHLWLLASETPWDITHDGRDNYLSPGVRYVMKMRSETIGDGTARYSCKVWPATSAEPAEWAVTADWPARDGSVIIVADYADVSFGPVTARPLAG